MVVIEGPGFSTRTESQWYAAQGWSLVNMTGHPEAVLARELAMCYPAVALVTDRDAGASDSDAVDQAAVFAEVGRNVSRLRAYLAGVVAALPAGREGCDCARALDGITVPFELP
jgi:5'-methylthioadenosine phosphorylase